MRSTKFVWLVVGLSACAGGTLPAEAPSPAATGGTAGATLGKAPDSGKVDRVGTADGSLAPDGTNDLSFTSDVDGAVAALFLLSVDESGAPTGQYQADTLVGQTESPKELGAKPGSGTSGLGVVEGEKMLNAADGSLSELGPGMHRLVLYVAPSPGLPPGTRLRVYVQRPDKTLIAGATTTN
jgi:hypothetical protein